MQVFVFCFFNDFGMNPGTRCPVDKIDYIDENNKNELLNVMMTMDVVKVYWL